MRVSDCPAEETLWSDQRGRTHEVSPVRAEFPRRLDRLTHPKVTCERLDPQAIDHERLQPRLLLPAPLLLLLLRCGPVRPVCQSFAPRRAPVSGQGDVIGDAGVDLGRDERDVGEVRELAVEEEAEAVERGRRLGEEFPVMHCRAVA